MSMVAQPDLKAFADVVTVPEVVRADRGEQCFCANRGLWLFVEEVENAGGHRRAKLDRTPLGHERDFERAGGLIDRVVERIDRCAG